MEFKINYSKNALKISGELTLDTIKAFEVIIYQSLKTHKNLTLDIGKVTYIDKIGIESIINLYKYSLKKEKKLLFFGKGAKDIVEELSYKNIA